MKSKFLNKKWLVLLMAVMLIVLSITGCGGKDDDDDDDDRDSKSKKELSIDKDDEDDDDKKDKDDEDKKDKKDKDDDADVEATPEPTPEPTEEPAVEEDWMTAYEDYFDTCGPLLKENVVMFMDGELDGVYLGLSYGYSDEYSAFYMEVCEGEYPYVELVMDSDYVYYYSEEGDDYYSAMAPHEDDFEADVMGMAEVADALRDSLEYESYGREDTNDDGVVYDSIECNVDFNGEECEAICYINRETQVLEGIEILDEDRYVVMTVEFIDCGEDGFRDLMVDTIEEYEGVEEIGYDELGEKFLGFFFAMMELADTEETVVDDGNVSAGIEGDDWSTAYDDFFDNGITIPESFEITTQMDLGGIVLDYVIAQDADVSMVRYRIGDYGVDAYTDGTVIVMENIGLNGSEWVYAEIESGDDVANILGADFTELMGGVTDSVSSSTYVEAVEENGVVYDVMEIDTEDTPALVYINRETQNVNRMILEAEGLEMICKFENAMSVNIPAEAANATGMTKDELAAYYQEAIVESVYASMGM